MGVGWAKSKQDRAAAAAFAQKAERYRRKGNAERAAEICREGLEKFPDHLSGRVTLGWALIDLGHHDEARAELESVLRRAPDNLAAIRGLATLHDRSESAVLDMDMPEGWHDGELVEGSGPPGATTAAHAAARSDEVSDGTTLTEGVGAIEAAAVSSAAEPPPHTAVVDDTRPQLITNAQAAMGDSAPEASQAMATPNDGASSGEGLIGGVDGDDLSSVLAGLEADLDESTRLDEGQVEADVPAPTTAAAAEALPAAESHDAAAVAEAAAEEERQAQAAREAEAEAERQAAEAAREAERLAAEAAAFEAAELQEAAQAEPRADALAFSDFGSTPAAEGEASEPDLDSEALSMPASLADGAESIAPEVAVEGAAEAAPHSRADDLSDAVAAFADAQAEAADLREVALEAHVDEPLQATEAGAVELIAADSVPASDETLADLDSPLLNSADAEDFEAVTASFRDDNESAQDLPDLDLVSLEPAEEPDTALFAQFESREADEADEAMPQEALEADRARHLEDALAQANADGDLAHEMAAFSSDWTPPAPALPSSAAEPARTPAEPQVQAATKTVAESAAVAAPVVAGLSPQKARQVADLESLLTRVRQRRLRRAAESVA